LIPRVDRDFISGKLIVSVRTVPGNSKMLLMIASRVSPIFDGEMIRVPMITGGDKQKRQTHFSVCPSSLTAEYRRSQNVY